MPRKDIYHVGQAEEINRAFKEQYKGQVIIIGKRYVFKFTNGLKCLIMLNSRDFYHLYIPTAVFLGKELIGYAFSEHRERKKDGRMVKTSGWIAFSESLDKTEENLCKLYKDNLSIGFNVCVNVS